MLRIVKINKIEASEEIENIDFNLPSSVFSPVSTQDPVLLNNTENITMTQSLIAVD